MSHVLSPGEIVEPEPQIEAPKDWQQNLNVRLICQECREDPPNLYEDTSAGDMICETCGLVLQQRGVDMRAEWRTFANDDQGNDDPSRVGDAPNLLLNGDQLHTSIAYGDGSMRSKDLHRAQSKATADKGNKALLQAFKEIGALCDGHHLSSMIADGAKHIFKDAEESGRFKGKPQGAVIAGCIFISCRRNGNPRTFREIYDMTNVTKKEIGRTFKLLEAFLQQQDKHKAGTAKVIGNGVVALNETYKATATTSPDQLCARYGGHLAITDQCKMLASALAIEMSKIGQLAGRSPLSGAAACIYMASHLMGEGQTPKQISAVVKVSESTIRGAYKKLYAQRERLFQPEWIKKGASLENLPKPS